MQFDYTSDILNKALQNYVVYFTYQKNGKFRHALGTNVLSVVPTDKHLNGIRIPSSEIVTYYDLQKKEYRSFRKELFGTIVYVFVP